MTDRPDTDALVERMARAIMSVNRDYGPDEVPETDAPSEYETAMAKAACTALSAPGDGIEDDLTAVYMAGRASVRRDGIEAAAKVSNILDQERYKVAIALQSITKAIGGRRWLAESGRGSYAWDDERYQQEFGEALEEIDAALEPLRKIASDWSDCPTDPLQVASNRNAALRALAEGDGQ